MWLQDKTIVLTGASGGLGSALAHALAPDNQLILIGRNSTELSRLQSTLPGKHEQLLGDLATAEGCQDVITQLVKSGHSIDVLVNNAGRTHFSSFGDDSPELIADLFALNLVAPVLLTRGLRPVFRDSGCRVVNIGSTFGSIGYPGFSLYGASKFGLRGFSEALSREWAHSNHSVLYVAPRAISTRANSPSVIEMNKAMGNQMDSPESVARHIARVIERNRAVSHFGWPEKMLAPINMLLPGVVTKVLTRQLVSIEQFMKGATHAS